MKRLLFIFGLLSCSHNVPAPTIPPPAPIICLKTPPPPLPVNITVAGSMDGCPAPFSVCLTAGNAIALDEYIDALKEWTRNAWTLCGPR
jgi:hypothetical protein